jgi:hypothetical protein
VTTRSILVASLPTGPQDPVTETPPRPPGSVRRTTTIDQHRGDPGEPMQILAHGRDLLTRTDGSAEILDETRLRIDLDQWGSVTAVEADPPVPALHQLAGAHSSRGFRRRVDEVVPDHRDVGTVLHQLLDDVPMAGLLTNYGATREMGDDFDLPAETAEGMADLCAGWERDATMLGAMTATGIFPIPLGPPAPDLASPDDPLAWHEMEALAPRSVRRRRRIDLIAGDVFGLDVHFRDSHLAQDGTEDVLHEYTLVGTVDPATLVVLSSEATARTLPWPECPRALGSAGRIVGERVSELRPLVTTDFKGITTCTHLNDVLRSLAGVTALARGLHAAS